MIESITKYLQESHFNNLSSPELGGANGVFRKQGWN